MAVIALVALGSAGVTIAALLGAFGSSLGMYGAIFVADRDGGGLRRLTQDQRFHGYAWSPDGRWIATATRSVNPHGIDVPGPLELARASTGRVHDVFLSGFGSDIVWRSNTSIELLLTSSHSEVVNTRLVDVGLTGTVRLGAWIGRVGGAAWTPDGSALAILTCGPSHRRFTIDVLSPSGRLAGHLGRLPGALPEGACADPDATADENLVWAPDGRSLYVVLSSGLWRFSRNGAAPRRIGSEEPSEPAVSPDGRQLVIGLSRTRAGDTGELLYLVPAGGGPARLLTPEFASEPAWSPDGRLVAFVPRAGEVIKTIASSGGTAATLTKFPSTKTEVCCLSWSPTGRQLAFDASAKPPES
jgi:Tol biopolymer transport system component